MNGDVTSLYWPPIWLLAAAASNIGVTTGGSTTLVFDAAAGVAPNGVGASVVGGASAAPTTVGMTAINEQTNEEWFVNGSLAWQQRSAI